MDVHDLHFITGLELLTEEGKEMARKILGASKKVKIKKDDGVDRMKLNNWLIKIKQENKLKNRL